MSHTVDLYVQDLYHLSITAVVPVYRCVIISSRTVSFIVTNYIAHVYRYGRGACVEMYRHDVTNHIYMSRTVSCMCHDLPCLHLRCDYVTNQINMSRIKIRCRYVTNYIYMSRTVSCICHEFCLPCLPQLRCLGGARGEGL